MLNVFFELDRLRDSLIRKGFDEDSANTIVNKARSEISATIDQEGEAAMQLAIEEGVAQRSPEFINELKLNRINMELTTESGVMEFSEPPFPMLPHLLKNAKPMKDGSGVYKVIPVGGEPTKPRPSIASNIYDAWKQTNAERIEASRAQRARVTPKGSKGAFRTATSKQSAQTQWVQPEKVKDFSEPVQSINKELKDSLDQRISAIIQDFEENY